MSYGIVRSHLVSFCNKHQRRRDLIDVIFKCIGTEIGRRIMRSDSKVKPVEIECDLRVHGSS